MGAELPQGSLYSSIREYWWKRVNVTEKGAMLAEEFSKGVVEMLSQKKTPSWYWKGGSTTLAWLTYYIIPQWLRIAVVSKLFGLERLSKLRSNT